MPYMHARFLPADASKLRPEDLPSIPDWFPLPPKDEQGNPMPPLTAEQRTEQRRGRQVMDACEGPHDGKRESVRLNADGSPPDAIVLYDGTILYVRDDTASTKHQLAYRYSPQLSPAHPKLMAAVAEGFREYGREYALEAAHDDATQLGYSER